MKNLISIFAFSILFGSCSTASKQTGDERTKAVLDSVKTANAISTANLEREKSIDSMNQVVAAQKEHPYHHVYASNTAAHNNVSESPVTNSAPAETKKKMNGKTKGALIGAGTGAVLGAVTGVLVDGKKGEGAVVGGLIGAAAGAGAGTAIGNSQDKKKAAITTTLK